MIGRQPVFKTRVSPVSLWLPELFGLPSPSLDADTKVASAE